MSEASRRRVLAIGLVALVLDGLTSDPALAFKKVSLFKVITAKDEIIIGLSKQEMDQLSEKGAGGVARALSDQGALSVWMYGTRELEPGNRVTTPVRKIGLIAGDTVRIEPFAAPFAVQPIE